MISTTPAAKIMSSVRPKALAPKGESARAWSPSFSAYHASSMGSSKSAGVRMARALGFSG